LLTIFNQTIITFFAKPLKTNCCNILSKFFFTLFFYGKPNKNVSVAKIIFFMNSRVEYKKNTHEKEKLFNDWKKINF